MARTTYQTTLRRRGGSDRFAKRVASKSANLPKVLSSEEFDLKDCRFLPARQRFETSPQVIVTVPAKDEAERLPAFFQALSAQVDVRGVPLRPGAFAVVLFVNNSSDQSAELGRQLARYAPFETHVVETQLPPEHSHAGGARRAAMDWAAACLGETRQGVILTTDADSRATPSWVHANICAFAEGADVVLGTVALDEEGERLPAALHARGAFEAAYEQLLTEISSLLDPEDCNPWPHHATISGASFAVTCAMYFAAGRLPRVRLGEDKAFVAALRRRDARIRFSPDVHVITSGRTIGRAPGGVADTLRLRSSDPGALCDEVLEPLSTAYRRSLWRGRLRRCGVDAPGWQSVLRISPAAARRARAAKTFGCLWQTVEEASPALQRRCLTPTELSGHIGHAKRLVSVLKQLASTPIELNEPLKLLETEFAAKILADPTDATTLALGADRHAITAA